MDKKKENKIVDLTFEFSCAIVKFTEVLELEKKYVSSTKQNLKQYLQSQKLTINHLKNHFSWSCHSERSEESIVFRIIKILRCTQNDRKNIFDMACNN